MNVVMIVGYNDGQTWQQGEPVCVGSTMEDLDNFIDGTDFENLAYVAFSLNEAVVIKTVDCEFAPPDDNPPLDANGQPMAYGTYARAID